MNLTQNVPLYEIPLHEPPAGISSNFVNPQTLAPAINAVSVVMMIWAVSFVTVRLYTNTQASRHLKVDDYFCIVATILAVSYTGLIISLNKVARHDIDIPRAWFDGTYWKRNYAETMLLGPTIFFAKGAILLLYLRIFTINRKMRYSIWFGLVWNFLLYWSGIPIATYYGTPRIGQPWDVVAATETCANLANYLVIQGVLAVALDLYIFILPIPIVLKLRISLQQRLSILGIFGTAILGITAAVVAMIYRIILYTDNHDGLWKTAHIYICITCENYVAIIVSSMPAVASVSRGRTSLPSWLASMRSRLSRSKSESRLSASRTKTSVSYLSGNGVWPLDQGVVADDHHAGDDIYLQLFDGRREGDYELGLVTTEIRAAADGGRTHEEGVVRKSVEVHQLTRQARSAA